MKKNNAQRSVLNSKLQKTSASITHSYGFTLAEVLITLSIIGIIAVITIPNIYEKYQRRVTVTKVKRMYSMLTNAYEQYLAENNNIPKKCTLTEQGAKDAFESYIKPYFNISYDAGTDSNKKNKMIKEELTKALDGSNYSKQNTYASSTNYYAVKLKDGSAVWIRGAADDAKANAVVFLI